MALHENTRGQLLAKGRSFYGYRATLGMVLAGSRITLHSISMHFRLLILKIRYGRFFMTSISGSRVPDQRETAEDIAGKGALDGLKFKRLESRRRFRAVA